MRVKEGHVIGNKQSQGELCKMRVKEEAEPRSQGLVDHVENFARK